MRYACGGQRLPGYWGQDGWEVVEVEGRILRIPKAVWIADVMSIGCQYATSA